MIYTSCYNGPITGIPIPISLGIPDVDYPLNKDDRLDFFCPTPEMLHYWKKSGNGADSDNVWARYTADFKLLIKERWAQIWEWLQSLSPEIDMTLLCHERTDDRCHRKFVGLLIQKYRPDCWGGELTKTQISAIKEPSKSRAGVFRKGDRVRMTGDPNKPNFEIQTHSPLIGWEFMVEDIDLNNCTCGATIPEELTPQGVRRYFGWFPFEFLEKV